MANKICKYGCGQLLAWDTEEGYFVEVENNNEQHTRERCTELRGGKPIPNMARDTVKSAVNQDITMAILQKLDKMDKKLDRILGEEEQQ